MISNTSRPLYRGTQITWYILSIIEGLLLVRFVFKLLQANPDAIFTNIIYTTSYIFVVPFITVFKNIRMETSIFEWTTLLAMFVYWLIAIAVTNLFIISKSVSPTEADEGLVN
jgi:hypothetical protein